MREITTVVKETINVTEDLKISGILTGDLTYGDRVNFLLTGFVNGNIEVNSDSFIKISGTLNGNIINRLGNIEIFGTVNGDIEIQDGQCFIHPDAVIKGQIIE